MPTIDPRPRINLLPLTDEQKETFAAAVRLVLAKPKAFADAVAWLKKEYSVQAYRNRHERQWEAFRKSEEKQARCAPSVEELAAVAGIGGTYSVATSWHSKNDENGNTIQDKDGNTKWFFDKERDDKRRADAKAFAEQHGKWTYRFAMKQRREKLAKIKDERTNGRAVSQVELLRLAMSDLADAEMEIGNDAEAHARKLVFVAYLLVWHETRDDLGEFGRWKWDGSAVRILAESKEEAERLDKLPPGRDRVLFLWFGFDKRDLDHGAGALHGFVPKLAQAIPLLPPPARNGKPIAEYTEAFRAAGERVAEIHREFNTVPTIGDSGPHSPTKQEATYTVAEVLEMSGVSDGTWNRYAKQADVTTPARGKRNHRYSESEVRLILQTILKHSSDRAVRTKCQTALDRLGNRK